MYVVHGEASASPTWIRRERGASTVADSRCSPDRSPPPTLDASNGSSSLLAVARAPCSNIGM